MYDSRIDVNVGVNLGTIIYGRDLDSERRELLVRYLTTLATKLSYLPTRGLMPTLTTGRGISVADVYIQLATTARELVAKGADVEAYYETAFSGDHSLKPAYRPDVALPGVAVIDADYERSDEGSASRLPHRLWRARLASEASAQQQRLVILGDPGSGKSMLLRHLAWMLARRGLEEPGVTLTGWDALPPVLPVVLPLRKLAGKLASEGTSETVVTRALGAEMRETYDATDAERLLPLALRTSALVMLDGLDEVPLEATPESVNRQTLLVILAAFARLYPKMRLVLTCRTRAWEAGYCALLGWSAQQQEERLAPWTLGQVRAFSEAWYAELERKGQLDPAQATQQAQSLLEAIIRRPQLRTMAETPLLLLLMARVLYDRGTLPRDRPQLYGVLLELLLGEWDATKEGQSLAQVLAKPDWTSEHVLPVLEQLSYEAHAGAQSEDGRGRLDRGRLLEVLEEFFEKKPGFEGERAFLAARRFLVYIDERSGLIVPDGKRSYVFAHLTLQEYCAGRALARRRDAWTAILGHREDDRWREPILLGLGAVQGSNALLIEKVLERLLSRKEGGYAKEATQWQRDLLLAAEIGQDRDWGLLADQGVEVDRLQPILRQGLVEALERPVLEGSRRVELADYLGALGDPRYPVTAGQWRAERLDTTFRPSEGYWCLVLDGTFRIGGWDGVDWSEQIALSPFWIAKYPITIAQYAPFVSEGYGMDADRWWSSEGRKWKQPHQRLTPWLWDDVQYASASRPVIGVSWYEAMAFCAWLDERLAGVLPEGYAVRLPCEAEWEVAASYDSGRQRRTYPWGEDPPTEERVLYAGKDEALERLAPVGLCPAGAAACGALDLLGNVWEWTATPWVGYPRGSGQVGTDYATGSYRNEATYVTLRGGPWKANEPSIDCGARIGSPPDARFGTSGFRVVVAPRIE